MSRVKEGPERIMAMNKKKAVYLFVKEKGIREGNQENVCYRKNYKGLRATPSPSELGGRSWGGEKRSQAREKKA